MTWRQYPVKAVAWLFIVPHGVISGGTCSTSNQLQTCAGDTCTLNYINVSKTVLKPTQETLTYTAVCDCMKPVFTREKLVHLFILTLTVIPTSHFPSKTSPHSTHPTGSRADRSYNPRLQSDRLQLQDHHPLHRPTNKTKKQAQSMCSVKQVTEVFITFNYTLLSGVEVMKSTYLLRLIKLSAPDRKALKNKTSTATLTRSNHSKCIWGGNQNPSLLQCC